MEMDSCKLFIGGISWETSEDRLREYFQAYGEVLEAVIMKDRVTGRARGFGFIVFADSNVAERVVLQKHMIDGKSVEAKKAVPRDDHIILNKSNSSLQGSPGPANTRKIFVGGLAPSVTEAEFKKYFAQFGSIMDVVVMYDHKTQRPRGFGFITYDSEEAVDRVLQKTFHELDGKMVEVKVAVPKETSPNTNRNLNGLNSFGSSRMSMLLNDYTQGFNLSPVSSHGAKPEGRYSPAVGNRGSFSPFGHNFGIELNFIEGNQNQSYVSGSIGGFGRPFVPGYNASLSRYGGQGNGSVNRNQLWGNNGGVGYISNSEITGGFYGNSGVGSIGEKWGTVGEGRSYRGYSNAELGIDYGRSNGMGIESRGGGGVVHTSSSGWGMSGEGGMLSFGYMNNTEELLLA
ncbi:heterogeneous nuclear ribonucleoprotein 1 [Eutrema salsugineum]|uniref:heterogeneous nuclear ribonucleoprotein 1 n=1 Tax=Eutrema salsugineum TaxID=72664 RepID=UPI000CECFBC2|nr:heterogeneous nuclear ribonucleoprotein 1 [Eutrema salsugineum]